MLLHSGVGCCNEFQIQIISLLFSSIFTRARTFTEKTKHAGKTWLGAQTDINEFLVEPKSSMSEGRRTVMRADTTTH